MTSPFPRVPQSRSMPSDLRTTGKIEITVERAVPVEVEPKAVATTAPYYEFREVTDASGLQELFRLRYRSFRGSKLEGLVPENEHGLDIDCYDSKARHFGLYGEQRLGRATLSATTAMSPIANSQLGPRFETSSRLSPTCKNAFRPIQNIRFRCSTTGPTRSRSMRCTAMPKLVAR